MPTSSSSHHLSVRVPSAVYDGLAALAAADEHVEDLAAALLAEVVALGSPSTLVAAARLATDAAELLATRLDTIQAEVRRMADVLEGLAGG